MIDTTFVSLRAYLRYEEGGNQDYLDLKMVGNEDVGYTTFATSEKERCDFVKSELTKDQNIDLFLSLIKRPFVGKNDLLEMGFTLHDGE